MYKITNEDIQDMTRLIEDQMKRRKQNKIDFSSPVNDQIIEKDLIRLETLKMKIQGIND